ncbi:MAG TPA: bacillithiol biosynthesis cysteine-adding enzyme BshC [Bryobacteraceae bacterium]|nr:bacillithiol biosynthesis cysteine-adding enzyme BshC [Bryobacteraceae bacterium]
MNRSCLNHSLIPGTSRLFSDYLYHFDRISGFYDWNPFDVESYACAAARIEFPADRRRTIVEALREQNPDAQNLSFLESPRGVAVVTGQQVGLFGGPAYTIFKAVTAARLAKQLNEEGIPAVPIFWLATEDHDIAEVDHAWTFDRSVTPVKLQATARSFGGPAGKAVLERVPLEELSKTLDGFAYKGEVLAMVERAYRPDNTLGEGFLELVRELLKPFGLIFLDPLHASFRRIVAPFLAETASLTPDIMRAVLDRNRELEQAGYHAQVFADAETSPIFLLDGKQRVPLKLRDGQFTNKHKSYTAEYLRQRAIDISPNALLRPVMQDFALPTVAYVGGPAEVAYMAQCQPVYHELLGRMPVIVPRNGFTLLDDHTVKMLDRYHLAIIDILDHPERVQSRIARHLVPADIGQRLENTKSAISSVLQDAERALSAFDPTLQASLAKSGTKIRYQLDKIAAKTARETFRRDEQAAAAARRLSNAIYPHEHLQERMYTILPFLAQHGLQLIPQLFRAAQLHCPDHMVRIVSELPLQ